MPLCSTGRGLLPDSQCTAHRRRVILLVAFVLAMFAMGSTEGHPHLRQSSPKAAAASLSLRDAASSEETVVENKPPHLHLRHASLSPKFVDDTKPATPFGDVAGEQQQEAFPHPRGQSLAPRPSWFWEVHPVEDDDPLVRAAKVYCSGELLSAVQLSGVFEDSKDFVDSPMRSDPEVILQAFSSLSAADKADASVLRSFVHDHFKPPGYDLVLHDPQDLNPRPPLLDRLGVNTATYQDWVAALNNEWKLLVRRVADEVFENPQRYSILRRRLPFVIPGGRFRESYYWDSYWIVLGLLACGMKDTARGLITNLLDDLSSFGFVPNGGRLYYLNRSQPPLLSDMVMALLEHDPGTRQDPSFVTSALSALEREYKFWMTEGQHAVTVTTAGGEEFVLNRYYTSSSGPRPESYKEDVSTRLEAGMRSTTVFADIAAAAESGWDFSSRWIVESQGGNYSLSGIETSRLLPVELNAYLYRMERNMARLAELHDTGVLHDLTYQGWASDRAKAYHQASIRRALAMDTLLWSEEQGCWADFDLEAGADTGAKPGEGVRSISGYLPLWSGVLSATQNGSDRADRVLASLNDSGLLQVGGIQTTLKETDEQWDAPNAWSPVQHMIIDGLMGLRRSDADELGLSLTRKWLASNHLGWENTGQMYEKYNARVPGARGEGGEYYPQVGFGWTNGVVLHLLSSYGQQL